MSFVPAQSNKDLFAVVGVVILAALGLLAWIRRDEGPRDSPTDETDPSARSSEGH